MMARAVGHGGGGGIRTHGKPIVFAGRAPGEFKARCNRPLCHASKEALTMVRICLAFPLGQIRALSLLPRLSASMDSEANALLITESKPDHKPISTRPQGKCLH
jgi:hypothetical protein